MSDFSKTFLLSQIADSCARQLYSNQPVRLNIENVTLATLGEFWNIFFTFIPAEKVAIRWEQYHVIIDWYYPEPGSSESRLNQLIHKLRYKSWLR